MLTFFSYKERFENIVCKATTVCIGCKTRAAMVRVCNCVCMCVL